MHRFLIALSSILLLGSPLYSQQCSLPSGNGCGDGPTLTGVINVAGNSGNVMLPGTFGGVTYTTLSGDVTINIGQNTTLTLEDGLIIESGATVTVGETNGNPIAVAGGQEYTKNGDPDFTVLSAQLSSCTDPAGCTVGGILPVVLSRWTAVAGAKKDRVVLRWSSAAEEENDYYFIEYATDGVNFREIGRTAGRGSATAGSDYEFEHTGLTGGMHYYRLGQRDFDGSTARFDVRSVSLRAAATLTAYPNPATPGAYISLGAEESASVRLLTLAGREVALARGRVSADGGGFELPASLRPGVYLLRVADETTRLVVR